MNHAWGWLSAGAAIYASTHGEVFCLDAATGQTRWRNPLRGLGWGLVSLAVSDKVFAGIKGAVVALDRTDGELAWQRH